ncbi:MAG: hypothetical protein NZ733_05545, partial [Aigarchaeota archaeon]|nr:hypothetical protein [Aigarchaeota archaeon]
TRWTLFSALGFLSLSTTMLPPRLQTLTLTLIYAPALYSVYDLLTSSNLLLLDLAGGYVISLPVLVLFSVLQARSVAGLVGAYISSVVMGMVSFFSVQVSDGNPRALLYSLVSSILRGRESELGSIDISTTGPVVPLMAVSLISLLLFAHQRLGFKSESLYGTLIKSGAIAISLLAFIVYYSMNFSDGAVAATLLVALSVLFGGAYAAIAARR